MVCFRTLLLFPFTLLLLRPAIAQDTAIVRSEQEAQAWLARPNRTSFDTSGLALLNDLTVMYMIRNEGLRALEVARSAVREAEHMLSHCEAAEEPFIRERLCHSYSLFIPLLRQQMAFDQAAEIAHRYIHEAKRTGNNSAIASAYGQLARCFEQLGDPASSLPLRRTEMAYARKASAINLAEYHLRLGQVHAVLGNQDSALYHFQQGLLLNDSIQAPHKSVALLSELVELFANQGNESRMEHCISRLNRLGGTVPVNQFRQRVHASRATVHFMKGRYEAAISEIIQADKLRIDLPSKEWGVAKHRLLALSRAGRHEHTKALLHLDSTLAAHKNSLGLDKVRALAQLQARKEHEQELMLAQAQIQVERSQKWLMAVIASSLLALGALSGLLLRSTRMRARLLTEKNTQILAAQAQLVRSEKEREAAQVRTRIARDIHDEIGGELTRIRLLGNEVRHLMEVDKEAASDTVERMARSAQEATGALRDIVWATDPGRDTVQGLIDHLPDMLHRQVEGSGMRIDMKLHHDGPDQNVDPAWKSQILRIVKEAVNNAVKYSEARSINLTFRSGPQDYELIVQDDGVGFDPEVRKDGNGLRNMRARTAAINGQFQIRSSAGSGCTITVSGPIPTDRSAVQEPAQRA